MNILLTPETMISQANQIRSYTQQHKEAMRELGNLVVSLDEVWQGNAQDEFVAEFQQAKPIFDKFQSALMEFSDRMEHVARKMEAADKSGASSIKSVNL